MTAEQIIEVANNGSNKAVTEAYKAVFNRDISGCKACQKSDARFYLRRYASQLMNGNTSSYKLKSEYADWQSITGIGPIHPLDDLKVVAIEASGFGYILEPIEAEPLGEPVEPETKPEDEQASSTSDTGEVSA